MRYFSIILTALSFIFAETTVAQRENFNADSAYAYLEHLCVNIGPRPMGSVNERAALKWAVEQFYRFGADTAYVMLVPEAKGRINTTSGVAVGIFRGTTDSTIVVGGHIDSSGREVPGANDDGSGTACVMELARNWGLRPHRFTLLFAAFGGEESGLVGSEYFVEHYADLDKVKLMLQIDMAGSTEALIPFIDVNTHQAPEWLVEDAYALDRTLGYNSLDYPTHFFSINNAIPGGGAGSDHQPFLDKDIPAIDFTAGVNTSPIHTQGDKLEFISKPMLARSGRLVEAMLTKYQEQGIPAAKKGNYMLWELGGGRLYIPTWLIAAINVTAVVLSMLAFYWSRKHRVLIKKDERVKFSGFKVFFITIIVAVFLQLGEAFMQFFKGLRYPWFAPLNHFLWFAAIWATFGIWISLQLTRKWKFSPDPYVYAKRALISLLVVFTLFCFATSRLALYPALSLIAISITILLPNSILKLLATVLAPLPMLRLMFFEMFPMGARSMAESLQGINTWFESFLYSAFLTAILILWYLPMLYLLGYTLTSSWANLNGLKIFRRPVVGFVLLLGIVGYGGYLYSFPAYDQTWRLQLTANAEYNLRNGKSQLHLLGSEFLREVTVTADTVHRRYDAASNEAELPLSFKADWFKLAGTATVLADSVAHVDWKMKSAQSWHKVTLTLRADTAKISNINTALNYAQNKEVLTFTWFADPPETLRVAASFSMHPKARLIREVKAEYPQTPVPLNVSAKYADVLYQTTVIYRDTLTLTQSALTTTPDVNSL